MFTESVSKVAVSKELADTIIKMKEHLRDEFGYDFAFGIIGGGQIISASNYKDGIIKPFGSDPNTLAGS